MPTFTPLLKAARKVEEAGCKFWPCFNISSTIAAARSTASIRSAVSFNCRGNIITIKPKAFINSPAAFRIKWWSLSIQLISQGLYKRRRYLTLSHEQITHMTNVLMFFQFLFIKWYGSSIFIFLDCILLLKFKLAIFIYWTTKSSILYLSMHVMSIIFKQIKYLKQNIFPTILPNCKAINITYMSPCRDVKI